MYSLNLYALRRYNINNLQFFKSANYFVDPYILLQKFLAKNLQNFYKLKNKSVIMSINE